MKAPAYHVDEGPSENPTDSHKAPEPSIASSDGPGIGRQPKRKLKHLHWQEVVRMPNDQLTREVIGQELGWLEGTAQSFCSCCLHGQLPGNREEEQCSTMTRPII